MAYDNSDIGDDVTAELYRIGALHEAEDAAMDGNLSKQGDYALAAIGRLEEVRQALVQYRAAVENLAKRNGWSLQDGLFCEADERVSKALRAIETREPVVTLAPGDSVLDNALAALTSPLAVG